MSRRVITVSEGVARLYGGSVVLREVLYRLTRTVDDSGHVRPSEATGPLEGTMDVGDMAEAVVLAGVEDLILQFDDGRRVAIALSSTGGRFAVHGVWPDAGGLRDFASRYTEAWCSQDPGRVAAFFAPDGSLRVNDAPPAIGRAAIAGVAQGFMTAFPDLQVLMDAAKTERDGASYHWTLIGTNTGPGGTGRPVRISGVERWRLSAEGLIAESLGSFDAVDYQRQLHASDTHAPGTAQRA
jgi:SnoaL-like polyketide cyclase